MPYIKQRDRDKLDPAIYLLAKSVLDDSPLNLDGMGKLNYAITRLCLLTAFPDDGGNRLNYASIALLTGVLENVKQELYRKLAAPYEDKKAEENGEVYP